MPQQRALAESKRIDTDGDGISDYDEGLIGTSPYLRDTDSDGMPDNVELSLGSNPACPEGQICKGERIDVSALASSTSLFVIGAPGGSAAEMYASFQRGMNQEIVNKGIGGVSSSTVQTAVVRDPVEIRKLIRDSGKLDEASLAKITDAQLLEIYDQAVAEAARSGALDQATGTARTTNPTQ
jgi:hypothetical protein